MDFLKAALSDAKGRSLKRPLAALIATTTSSSSTSSTPSSSSSSSSPLLGEGATLAGSGNAGDGGAKKYMRRGEVDALLRQKEADAQRVKDELSGKNVAAVVHAKTEHVKGDQAKRKQTTSDSDSSEDDHNENSHLNNLSVLEVKMRLRKLGHPITLFGETRAERLKRLKQAEIENFERTEGSHGKSNLMKEIEDEVEQELLRADEADRKRRDQDNDEDTEEVNGNRGNNSDNSDDEDDEHRKKGGTANSSKEEKKRESKYLEEKKRAEFHSSEKYVMYYFKRLLFFWEMELSSRSKEEMASVRGKMASGEHKQTRRYIKPFFSLCKEKTVALDVLSSLEQMVTFCMERNYKESNKVYFKLAIGNQPWPMGVTSVGIHERSGREKIAEGKVAHVMNDEKTRKYIHAIKRLCTYAAQRFPPLTLSLI